MIYGLSLASFAKAPRLNANRWLMGMTVVAPDGAAGHFFDGHHAAFQFAAADVFELNGGMADEKVLAQDVIEFHEDAGAL